MQDQSGSEAVAYLVDAASAVGLSVVEQAPASDCGVDALIDVPGGSSIGVVVKRTSLASAHDLHFRIEKWSPAVGADVIPVLISDRITADARMLLGEAGWSWLDLRGHLHLAGKGLFVDADIPALVPRNHKSTGPFAGRVGIEVATMMLLNPDESFGVRQLSAEIGRAPSSVSEAISTFRRAELVDDDSSPRVPEMFWELASAWRKPGIEVESLPPMGDRAVVDALRVNMDDIAGSSGWALSDDRAAAAYGAPIAVRSDHPPEFYVPDEKILRRSANLLGRSRNPAVRAATIRVAPVAVVCNHRVDAASWSATSEYWPLAQPLFVALDLAQDPGRGREVLSGWDPEGPWRRVW